MDTVLLCGRRIHIGLLERNCIVQHTIVVTEEACVNLTWLEKVFEV